MFSWEFAFCLFICTWIHVHKTKFERNSSLEYHHEDWMGKRNMQTNPAGLISPSQQKPSKVNLKQPDLHFVHKFSEFFIFSAIASTSRGRKNKDLKTTFDLTKGTIHCLVKGSLTMVFSMWSILFPELAFPVHRLTSLNLTAGQG